MAIKCCQFDESIQKADFYGDAENQEAPFSMRGITDYYSAKLFLDRILSKLDIELVSDKFNFAAAALT